MTREEQIIKEVEMYTDDVSNLAEWGDGWEDYDDYKYVKKAFINGAKWADKTMVEKACEWLNKTLYIHTEEIEDKHWNEIKTFDWVTSDFDSVSDFIEGFRKAMEE